jgi:hypothetical protein
MTSHSPTLIERTFELSKKYQRKYKTIYLSDTFGPVQARHDFSWPQIYSDLHIETVAASTEVSLPKVNVYFEDQEGCDLFNHLLFRHPIKRYLGQLPEVSLGCSNYIQLVKKGVPEFASNSLIVLDADAVDGKGLDTIALLPGALPPDQLIFEFLHNLPANDAIWQNTIQFTRAVFTSRASKIRSTLGLTGASVDLKSAVVAFRKQPVEGKPKLREIFKEFYKHPDLQAFLHLKGAGNPWKRWIKENSESAEEFRADVVRKVSQAMQNQGVDPARLAALNNI